MKRQITDKERLEDVKRKKMLLRIAAVIIVVTVIICIALSQMAVGNVDTKKGIAKIKELEGRDITDAEAAIAALEEQERQADEAYASRPLSEKFASAVIIGDSITTGFVDYEILNASSVVAEVGVELTELDGLLDTAAGLNPATVFLALGLNDITATEGDTALFKEQYRAVIAGLRERLPDAKICINSILPVQQKAIDERPEYAGISGYNDTLKALCEEEELLYIDNTDLVKEEYYEPDGEHMKADFYPEWGGHMAEVAGL
ncbi:GDSL-type esterase/lipase family protein [Bariatricus massiliensis]|uniref:GDSL-type esterase/lipase family protein n=1 Tax=Bariatricus massiliensis TaxID=1745713 RepID=A0ABS8DDU4_9FIRM|nr:GDSL-type esterase/lipase family protein [Bariatricus massiliensis]MCB7302695.1 GDSL-type esterase/lipase family protein [Bariatricus massiliensis]MCB7373911.1 GDSL-type esterase/lipase family protein [Bariatricus massiliensis]MCB7386581.1 GDSL-type esterase/lipase family protein [Bariatricus massiliensis]MCB7410743.1 GDSL-type esterase/lipase family protein [Bariatricus massiliensis]MCQ5253418.1 GDSL-type esterase/lipase family protein [Bariatricus massiliensis]